MTNILNVAHRSKAIMPQLTSMNAGQVIRKSDQTIRRHVHEGRLPAWREGLSGKMWIDVEELRKFAEKYNYFFDEDAAATLATD